MRGVQFATQEINQQGGVLGRELELHIETDSKSSEKSHEIAERMSKNLKIRAVVGMQPSVSTIPVTYTYEGSNIVYLAISATNNPTSFSLAGNCREFDFFGGNGGAVFEGQDCTTGVTKQVSVSSGQLRRMCFFIGTVSKIGGTDDATFTDIGGCSSDSIPDGMIFTQDTGTISGVPTEPGCFDGGYNCVVSI